MLIHSASQLLTLKGKPQRGHELGRLDIIEDGAVVVTGSTITAVGQTKDLLRDYPGESLMDASGHVIMPGFVDPHTHLPWAGNRANEFEMRLMGMSYLEIMAAGGGIASTVRSTRDSSPECLHKETRERIQSLFLHGTTTVEAKTGYCLNLSGELLLLDLLATLDREGPMEIIPTFLGAHAFPPEYKDAPDEYVHQICTEMLPAIQTKWEETRGHVPLPFVDVFCDRGAFSKSQTETIFKAARELGFPLKVHSDEFENLGGTSLAVEYGAVSADHLVKTSEEDIAALGASDTVAVALPCTPFGLGHHEYTPAKKIIEADALFALASDLNPGTAWCGNMQFCIALACRMMQLTPAQAVVAATLNAAAAINQSERLGSIQPGKQADMILLSVDDYRHLAYRFGTNLVSHVVKAGQIYPSTEIT